LHQANPVKTSSPPGIVGTDDFLVEHQQTIPRSIRQLGTRKVATWAVGSALAGSTVSAPAVRAGKVSPIKSATVSSLPHAAAN
jgi:hypothetical protein